MSACSPINSLQPFDQEQAALILKNDYVIQPAQEKIEITLPQEQDWKKVNLAESKRNIMLIPNNADVNHWDQSIRTQIIAYFDEPKITAKKMVLSEMKYAHEHCNQVKAMLIKQTKKFIIYKLDIANCPNQANQIQIGKTFNGIDAVYTLYYTALTDKVPITQLKQMSHMIKTAQLVRNNEMTHQNSENEVNNTVNMTNMAGNSVDSD